jgi:hypothetical protein
MRHALGRTFFILKYKDNITITEKTPEIKIVSWAHSPLKEDRAMVKPGFSL